MDERWTERGLPDLRAGVAARDPAIAGRLWALSEQLTGVTPRL